MSDMQIGNRITCSNILPCKKGDICDLVSNTCLSCSDACGLSQKFSHCDAVCPDIHQSTIPPALPAAQSRADEFQFDKFTITTAIVVLAAAFLILILAIVLILIMFCNKNRKTVDENISSSGLLDDKTGFIRSEADISRTKSYFSTSIYDVEVGETNSLMTPGVTDEDFTNLKLSMDFQETNHVPTDVDSTECKGAILISANHNGDNKTTSANENLLYSVEEKGKRDGRSSYVYQSDKSSTSRSRNSVVTQTTNQNRPLTESPKPTNHSSSQTESANQSDSSKAPSSTHNSSSSTRTESKEGGVKSEPIENVAFLSKSACLEDNVAIETGSTAANQSVSSKKSSEMSLLLSVVKLKKQAEERESCDSDSDETNLKRFSHTEHSSNHSNTSPKTITVTSESKTNQNISSLYSNHGNNQVYSQSSQYNEQTNPVLPYHQDNAPVHSYQPVHDVDQGYDDVDYDDEYGPIDPELLQTLRRMNDHPNRENFEKIKNFAWVQGFSSEGFSIDVFVDFSQISQPQALAELCHVTGELATKFNVRSHILA